jgi:hypothetical protein
MMLSLLTNGELDAANDYGNMLQKSVHERELPATQRVQASAGCFAIAQDHHHAIVLLLGSGLYASAFALVRCGFDAYIRGEWLKACATDSQINQFLLGERPLEIGPMVTALEQTAAFQEQGLSAVKRKSWATMCDFTHTGGLHVQRWLVADGIEPNYSRIELLEVLQFADMFATLSVLGMLGLAGDVEAAEAILNHYRRRIQA